MFAPQDSPIAYVAYFMLYLVHGTTPAQHDLELAQTDANVALGFLDNAIIVLGFIEDFSMKKLWGVFFVSITVSVLKVTIVVRGCVRDCVRLRVSSMAADLLLDRSRL